MQVKDISTLEALQSIADWKATDLAATELLAQRTGAPIKVCYRKLEKMDVAGFTDFGVSLRTGWLTDKGKRFIADAG